MSDEPAFWVYEFGDFRLNATEHVLLRRGNVPVHLTPKAIETLITLVERSGHVVSKDELMASVWPNTFVEENSLNRNISSLRKALDEHPSNNSYIETIPKIGYRFAANVRKVRLDDGGKTTLSAARNGEMLELRIPGKGGKSRIASRKSYLLWLVLAAVVFVALPASLAYWFWPGGKNLPAADQPTPESQAVIRLTYEQANQEYPMWTRDGRIRFVSFRGHKDGESFVMNANGGGQSKVTDIPKLRVGNWSPNGKRVVFWKYDDDSVYLASADGTDEKKLPFVPGNLAWSPDASRFVFQSKRSREPQNSKEPDLYVYTIETGKVGNVTNSKGFDGDPDWSPDGKKIVFVSSRDGNIEVYLMEADGSGVRRLTNHPAWDAHPAFSPDGTQIIFNSDRDAENNDVFLMNTDGRNVVKLTTWPTYESVQPGCWSPDGTKIAFVSDRDGAKDIYVTNVETFSPKLVLSENATDMGEPSYLPDGVQIIFRATTEDKSSEIRVFNRNSGESRVILKATDAARPKLSTDDSRIAFQNKVDGQTDVFVMRLGGTDLVNLSSHPANDHSPSWSPDGRHIVFVSNRGADSGTRQLFIVNTDGRGLRPLTPQKGWEFDPAWSPDGSTILFACDREDVPGNGLDICSIGVDGRSEKYLLRRPAHDVLPAWSPEGSRIAFVAHSDGNSEIYLMNSDGTGLLRLTRSIAEDTAPQWSPDGNRIIFSSNRTGRFAIYEILL